MKTQFTLLTLSDNFPDEESCIRYFEKMRWGDEIVSPYDASSKVYKCGNGKYKCKNTGRYFDVKTGTAFANTKLPMRAWFYAMMLFLSHKRGVSSCQLARDLGITQRQRGRCFIRLGNIWQWRIIIHYPVKSKLTKHL